MQDQDKQEAVTPETAAPAAEQAQQPQQPQGAPAADAAQAPAAEQANLAQLLAAAEARANEMQDAFMRAKAESENIRRRAQEDVTKAHKFAVESFAEALVPVKDSLEMALKVDNPTLESLKEGVEMTLKQLSAAFERNRLLEVMPAPGEKLDPNRHQAVSVVPSEQEANTVVTVLQKGYMISERLLRPAIVTVAAPK
jgi:molecular chaperone GrpE